MKLEDKAESGQNHYPKSKKYRLFKTQRQETHRNDNQMYASRFEQLIYQLSQSGSLHLSPFDTSEKKFSGKNRLYVANIGKDICQDDLKTLFGPYGEISDVYVNADKSFGFVQLDYHHNALMARKQLDGVTFKGRTLKVKISPSTASVKVKNLVPAITGELLCYAFSVFGPIDNATVLVDEKGKSIGEGIIDFARKISATQAIKACHDKCYFLSNALKPVIVEPYEPKDQSVGFLDRHVSNRNLDFIQERSVGPRLSESGSFEHEYGTRWKSLFELYATKREALEADFRSECDKLEAQMEYARYEHETEKLREQLRLREMDNERWAAVKKRQADEEILLKETKTRHTQEHIQIELVRRRPEEVDLTDNAAPSSTTGGMLSTEPPQSGLSMGAYQRYGNAPYKRRHNNNGHWVREGGDYRPKRKCY